MRLCLITHSLDNRRSYQPLLRKPLPIPKFLLGGGVLLAFSEFSIFGRLLSIVIRIMHATLVSHGLDNIDSSLMVEVGPQAFYASGLVDDLSAEDRELVCEIFCAMIRHRPYRPRTLDTGQNNKLAVE